MVYFFFSLLLLISTVYQKIRAGGARGLMTPSRPAGPGGALLRLRSPSTAAFPMAAVETPPVVAATVAAAAAASRKRRPPKGQYSQAAKRARPGGRCQLEAGMCGILITCNMNERKCVAEAYSLLGEYGEQLYGPEQVRPGGRSHWGLPYLAVVVWLSGEQPGSLGTTTPRVPAQQSARWECWEM